MKRRREAGRLVCDMIYSKHFKKTNRKKKKRAAVDDRTFFFYNTRAVLLCLPTSVSSLYHCGKRRSLTTYTSRMIVFKSSTFGKIKKKKLLRDCWVRCWMIHFDKGCEVEELLHGTQEKFNVLLTVHHAIILGNCPT